jgi:hypothetical protein
MSSGSNIEKENILLEFSTTKDRASLFEDQDFDREYLFSLRQKNKNPKKCFKKRIDLKNGQICFHIAGYQGTHNISVLDLVHCIPFSRLKAASKKFFKHSGVKKKRKKRTNKKKLLKSNEALHHGQWTNQEKDFVNDDGAAV